MLAAGPRAQAFPAIGFACASGLGSEQARPLAVFAWRGLGDGGEEAEDQGGEDGSHGFLLGGF
jgi:hypothetical protein